MDGSTESTTSAPAAEAPALPQPEPALAQPDGENGVLVDAARGPRLPLDAGLYAVLGLVPSVSDAEIQTTYRRQAARLLADGTASDIAALRRLNMAYEVLGNPVRRAEYDRSRISLLAPPAARERFQASPKGGRPVIRRRSRPHQVVQPRGSGHGDVLVLLIVVALSIAAGTLLILPRLSINLSALNTLSNVLPVGSNARKAIDPTPTAAPSATRVPTPTPAPGLADRFAGSTVTVSSANPGQNTPESILIHLRRDGKPAANLDVWANVEYRTTAERWPATGAVKTDDNGAATITFDVGKATPGFQVQVHVVAQVDEDQQLSWSTAFTPH
ncbi:MAG TPA: DnaJ domain-containing protein [Chloroflexota bacterium]|nr:DnaJ domain-containing protein [Chloroflexota bacterium]